ncbi:hypothetical protein DH2020_044720 [Rehmannia glutinosa]|uniref:Ubiquitin-like domain-containing protein n=1 Tax=Rehmannia glutinosa TaxID=99300 RepID=A0ABR0UGS7_REHGL
MGAEGESSVCMGGDEQVNVNIRYSNGSKFSVKTSLLSTVGEFKGVLAQNCDVPAEQQRLIYKGRILKDDQTLVSCDGVQLCLQADHTVHMVRGSAPAPTPPAAVPASAGTPIVFLLSHKVAAPTQGRWSAWWSCIPIPGLGSGAFGGTGGHLDYLELDFLSLNKCSNS